MGFNWELGGTSSTPKEVGRNLQWIYQISYSPTQVVVNKTKINHTHTSDQISSNPTIRPKTHTVDSKKKGIESKAAPKSQKMEIYFEPPKTKNGASLPKRDVCPFHSIQRIWQNPPLPLNVISVMRSNKRERGGSLCVSHI